MIDYKHMHLLLQLLLPLQGFLIGQAKTEILCSLLAETCLLARAPAEVAEMAAN